MDKEITYIGIRIPASLKLKIKKLAITEYCGNESMAIRIILQNFFAKKVNRLLRKTSD